MTDPKGQSGAGLDTRLAQFRARPQNEPAAPLADDLLKAGRSKDALGVLDAALKAAANEPRLLWLRGRAHLDGGDLDKAQADLVAAGKLAPRSKEVFKSLGEVLLKRGDGARAIKVLERAKEIDATDRATELLIGQAQRLIEQAGRGKDDSDMPPRVSKSPRISSPGMPARGVVAPTGKRPSNDDEEEATSIASEDSMARAVAAANSGANADDGDDTDLESEATSALIRGPMMAAMMAPKKAPAPAPTPPKGPSLPAWNDDGDALTTAHVPASPFAKFDAPAAPAAPAAKKTMMGMPAVIPMKPQAPVASVAPTPRVSLMEELGSDLLTSEAPQAPRPQSNPGLRIENGPASSGAIGFDDLFGGVQTNRPAALTDLSSEQSGARPLALALEELEAEERREKSAAPVVMPTPIASMAPAAAPPNVFERRVQEAKTRRVLIGIAGALLGVAAAGAAGYGYLRAQKARQASALFDQASHEAVTADVGALLSAENMINRAHEIDPTAGVRDGADLPILLLVDAERTLEEGLFDTNALEATVARSAAKQAAVPAPFLNAARLLLTSSSTAAELPADFLAQLAKASDADPRAAYILGRLSARYGLERARPLLTKASTDANLVSADLALAELDAEAGSEEEALNRVQRVLATHPNHVRAGLYRAFFTARTAAPDAAERGIAAVAPKVKDGSTADVVVLALARARVASHRGDAAGVNVALDEAMNARATDPRVRALIAREAARAGNVDLAVKELQAALAAVPTNALWKTELVRIYLAADDSERALAELAKFKADDPSAVLLRASAHLLRGTPPELDAAKNVLMTYIDTVLGGKKAQAPVGIRAMLVRIDARHGERASAIDARALMGEAPSDPNVLLAVAEAGLCAHDPGTASDAMTALTRARPDDIEGNYWLGMARRAAGDAEGSILALRKALNNSPRFLAARVALMNVFLEAGKYADAEEAANALSDEVRSVNGVSAQLHGKVGKVLAALGRNQLSAAKTALESISQEERSSQFVKVAAARVLLADHHATDAVTLLKGLSDASQPFDPSVIDLYGDALYAAGQFDTAGNTYRAVLARDADDPGALVGGARVFLHAGKYDDALSNIDRLQGALLRNITTPALRANMFLILGQVKLARRDNAAASDALAHATALEGAPPESFFFLGESLTQIDAAKAQEAYLHYLQIAPTGEFASRAKSASTRH